MGDYMCPAEPTVTHCCLAAKVNDLIAERDAEIERLRAALERIADTDPDDGTAWFHSVARAALGGDA